MDDTAAEAGSRRPLCPPTAHRSHHPELDPRTANSLSPSGTESTLRGPGTAVGRPLPPDAGQAARERWCGEGHASAGGSEAPPEISAIPPNKLGRASATCTMTTADGAPLDDPDQTRPRSGTTLTVVAPEDGRLRPSDFAHPKRRRMVFLQHAADAEIPELARLAPIVVAEVDCEVRRLPGDTRRR